MFDVREMFVLKNPNKFQLSRVIICDTSEGFFLFIAGTGCFYHGEDYQSFGEAEFDLIDIFIKKRLKLKKVKLSWIKFKAWTEKDQEKKSGHEH